MNKNYQKFFEEQGITFTTNIGYGLMRGYETNVFYNAFSPYPLKMHISFYASHEIKEKISNEINNLKIKYFTFELYSFGLILCFNGMTAKGLLKKLPDHLNNIFYLLDKYEVLKTDYCPYSGLELTEENKDIINYDHLKITVSKETKEKLNMELQEEEQNFKNTPNNYIRGFLGALIGGVVGAILTIIIFFMGYISAISSLVAMVLGSYLYRKFKGKENIVMIVIVSITSILFVILAIVALYTLEGYGLAIEDGQNVGILEGFSYALENEEFASSFYYDLGLTALFSGIGLVYQIYYLSQKIKRVKSI